MYQDARCPEDSTKSPRTTALSLITFRRSSRSLTLGSVTLGSHPTGTCSVSPGVATPEPEVLARRSDPVEPAVLARGATPLEPGGLMAVRLRRAAMSGSGWGCCLGLAVGPRRAARPARRGAGPPGGGAALAGPA